MRPVTKRIVPVNFGKYRPLALSGAAMLLISTMASATFAQCHRDGAYDRSEIARSGFFTTRELTKFSPGESGYPIASRASARYCFSRGCTGQLDVRWSDSEQLKLAILRTSVVKTEDAPSELRFIKIAVMQMESWLYARLRNLDSGTVNRLMRDRAADYGQTRSEHMSWLSSAMSSYDRFDKECTTYAMEATQHLLVLANLGLLRHWNVTEPAYRYGVPGHWTAGIENRETCARYRLDLNSRASARYRLHQRGSDPAQLALRSYREYSYLYPGIDGNGRGRPTGRQRPALPDGGFALNGPRSSTD
ncbi:MAG: hypothetical protein R3D27_12575 [Hyphomicrobiaceae bacterium]